MCTDERLDIDRDRINHPIINQSMVVRQSLSLRLRVVSIKPSLGASLQVLCVQEERVGAVHDPRPWRPSDGVAPERADVHDLSIVVSALRLLRSSIRLTNESCCSMRGECDG